ncbi:MAG: phage tail sheath subtilisin-like domain-containing protein, partial [Treponemataceae bacterium]
NGTRWQKEFIVTGSASKAGLVTVSVNGKTGSIAINDQSSSEQVVSAITSVINGLDNCPVDATANENTLSITSLINGITGNFNKVFVESSVAGITIEEGETIEGEGTVDLKSILSQLDETRFNFIATELSDEINLKSLALELTSRYSATRQIGGRAFACLRGEVGDLSTQGTIIFEAAKQNNPHLVLLPQVDSKTPRGTAVDAVELPCVFASSWLSVICRILCDDPSANTLDTTITDITGVDLDFDSRQFLLENGVCTYRRDTTGTLLIERLVTSYTENTDGEKDTSYLNLQVVETVDAVRTRINSEARKRFKTWKLSKTAENFGSGSKVMSPSVWRSFLAEMYQHTFIQELNWCQDFESYKNSIVVEVKADSKTRLEYIHQPVLIGQFYIAAGLNQFA